MKSNKVLIIIAVVLLNIIVVFMLGQSLLGKTSRYDDLLSEARELGEAELCTKSIAKYQEAVTIKDRLDIRLEMIDVYEKGIDIGEFTNKYDIYTAIEETLNTYCEEAAGYERACEFFLKYNRYEECANALMLARDFGVSTDMIEEYRAEVRYQHVKYYSMYTEILPQFDGLYSVKTSEGYTYINEQASPSLKGSFDYTSSFSEGYAFVTAMHPDGKQRSFVIDKEGARQAYFDGVESSSGVGRAKNENGDSILLLSCKVGDKYKYYDINGNEMFGDYVFAGRFRNNIAAVMESEGRWKLIDGTGNTVSDITFSDVVLNEFDECAPKGLIIAAVDGEYRIYDLKVSQVGGFKCDGAKAFVDDYAAFRSGDKWGFVSADGSVIIEAQYEDAKSFSCGMGAVKTSDGWVFINSKNEIVIQDTFEEVDYLNDKGICFVKADGYWCYLKFYYTGK